MSEPMPERWLPVVGAEGYYEVSDRGRVASLHRPGLILRPSYSNSGGYALCLLTIDGRRLGKYAHRLVMEAFVGPCPDGQQVRHLDDDPRNNVLSNLTYGTSKENHADKLRNNGHHYGNRDACEYGHEFTPENTYTRNRPDGTFLERVCRACGRETSRVYREKRRLRTCTLEGCDKPQFAKKLCQPHYLEQKRAAYSVDMS